MLSRKRNTGFLYGFTIIELMVSIFVTLIALGTFYKLYNNSVKAEKTVNSRISIAIQGEHIIDTLSSPLRLAGLTSEYEVDGSGDWDPTAVIQTYDGGSGTDSVNIRFFSPFGGPIAKLNEAPIEATPPCTLKISGSSAMHSGIAGLRLMTGDGVFSANVTAISEGQITIDSILDRDGVAFAGNCGIRFPQGTLITGPDNDFEIRYTNSGSGVTTLQLQDFTSGRVLLNYSSDADSPDQMPLFIFQFLREYVDAGGSRRRTWFSTLSSATELSEVKSVRIGFVLLSNKDRIVQKNAAAVSALSTQYCPFVDGECYTLTNPNRNAYVFRRVIHLRNFDYLKRNSLISY